MFRSSLRNIYTKRALYNQSNLPQSFVKSFAINTRYFTSSQPLQSSTIYGTSITEKNSKVLNQIPEELLLHTHNPKPVRHEIIESKAPLKTKDLEKLDIKVGLHRDPVTLSDKLAFKIVKLLRVPSDWLFKKKYVHRAVMLETVAAVPGMVGGTIRHLRSLRKLQHDGGWIDHLLHEAENERMHLMTWMRISKPKIWERGLITIVQGVFYNAFFALYLLSPKTAHRVVGYLEEEAIVSYTSFLNEIENGHIENTKDIPDLAIDYWHLDKDTATLKDLVLAVRADEATHRDTNHHFADRIILGHEDLRDDIKRIFDKSESNKVKRIAGLSQDASEKWKWNN
ncbi:19327_t:CDS:2 [Funneliformis geosporum]|uniref:Alternative oxidase n=1 Tax=Funneliformis geosporum TaxID=1117311 RepID=A0A9W4SGT2_9GLOM|nr:19327_t:CDS:2 [Funneliformis geosporum]CAI2169131.1 19420_t:CDS:2 [Funneliformis geosporum]